jgi:hypothetical protein
VDLYADNQQCSQVHPQVPLPAFPTLAAYPYPRALHCCLLFNHTMKMICTAAEQSLTWKAARMRGVAPAPSAAALTSAPYSSSRVHMPPSTAGSGQEVCMTCIMYASWGGATGMLPWTRRGGYGGPLMAKVLVYSNGSSLRQLSASTVWPFLAGMDAHACSHPCVPLTSCGCC